MAMAWAETSITTHSQPAFAMRLSSVWVTMGSGVVRLAGITSSPIIEHTVPIRPVFFPASSRMDLIRKLEVVLPLVPVMPISIIFSAGFPKNSDAIYELAMRTSSTSTCGTSMDSSRSTTSATAPFATACGAKSWASMRRPGVQKNSAPGVTCLESEHREATSVSSFPIMRTLPGILPTSAFSFIRHPPVISFQTHRHGDWNVTVTTAVG